MIGGAMNSEMFNLYVETQLVPTLREGGTVIFDNLSSHNRPGAAQALREIGTWFLFLPPYILDLNPIEIALSERQPPEAMTSPGNSAKNTLRGIETF